jgi:hypothetical protein
MPHDRGVTLRAQLPVVGRIGRIAFDLVDDAVVSDMNERAA